MPDSTEENKGQEIGLGPYLRACREARGSSLEEVANTTRISKSYLDSIEKEQFDKLPSPAYCKGFLRIYAGYLGLSGDDIIARYELAIGILPTQYKAAGQLPGETNDLVSKRSNRYGRLLPLVLLIVVLTFAFLFNEKDEAPPAKLNKQLSSPVVEIAPVQPVRSSAVINKSLPTPLIPVPPEQPATTTADQQKIVEPNSQGVILKLKVNQDSWVNVDIDGRISQQYDLKSGDLIEWKADNEINLDIGNAGGVEAELNGNPLPTLGANGKAAHIKLNKTGLKKL